jgi:hypothetical protein
MFPAESGTPETRAGRRLKRKPRFLCCKKRQRDGFLKGQEIPAKLKLYRNFIGAVLNLQLPDRPVISAACA